MNFLNTYNKRLETRQGRNTAISSQQSAISHQQAAISKQQSAFGKNGKDVWRSVILRFIQNYLRKRREGIGQIKSF
jgi:hypothetical protein